MTRQEYAFQKPSWHFEEPYRRRLLQKFHADNAAWLARFVTENFPKELLDADPRSSRWVSPNGNVMMINSSIADVYGPDEDGEPSEVHLAKCFFGTDLEAFKRHFLNVWDKFIGDRESHDRLNRNKLVNRSVLDSLMRERYPKLFGKIPERLDYARREDGKGLVSNNHTFFLINTKSGAPGDVVDRVSMVEDPDVFERRLEKMCEYLLV